MCSTLESPAHLRHARRSFWPLIAEYHDSATDNVASLEGGVEFVLPECRELVSYCEC